MGSASIVSNLGQGQYSVNLTKSQAAITAQKTSLTTRKTEIEAAIAAKETELVALNVIQNAKYEDWKTAVGNYALADPPTKALRKAVTDAQAAYITAHSNVTKKQTEINLLGLELVSVNKRLEQIETALAVESRTVWCTDYSTALTGTVGTLEVNGEADQIIIMPGGAAGAGLLQHPLAMTPSGVFVNSAKLPAWQKWMPTYRIGTITALDTDNNTADVALDDAKSVAQDIAINQSLSLSAVPVDYMDSNANSFLVGDRVVVKFEGQKQESPKVVGFESNPRIGDLKFIAVSELDGYTPVDIASIALSHLVGSYPVNYTEGVDYDVEIKDNMAIAWFKTSISQVLATIRPVADMGFYAHSVCTKNFSSDTDYFENGAISFGTYTVKLPYYMPHHTYQSKKIFYGSEHPDDKFPMDELYGDGQLYFGPSFRKWVNDRLKDYDEISNPIRFDGSPSQLIISKSSMSLSASVSITASESFTPIVTTAFSVQAPSQPQQFGYYSPIGQQYLPVIGYLWYDSEGTLRSDYWEHSPQIEYSAGAAPAVDESELLFTWYPLGQSGPEVVSNYFEYLSYGNYGAGSGPAEGSSASITLTYTAGPGDTYAGWYMGEPSYPVTLDWISARVNVSCSASMGSLKYIKNTVD